MANRLYKARWPYRDADLLSDDPGNMCGLRQRAIQWLNDNNREAHLISVYLNSRSDHGELVMVLNNPNTALMLKLAVT